MLKWLYRIIGALILFTLLVIGVFFAVRNPQLISLDFVIWQSPEFSIALHVILAFGIGVILALVASSAIMIKSERKVRLLTKRLAKNQAELASIRKDSIAKELDVSEE
ncbi:LapA family protein [Marinomonas sp. 15G1-11]|uniref:LapA family protein n=1 Tax=Marinomonas phaeophyticola TaxID=3004091 RepID=A0ABT4JNZ3_9GAMM|nr:LapA family protein [Marinomonas sp. 15G1-11]MCZ2720095.1 LapA family protein [Marinomonas sp. 15G1-11]